MIMIFLLMISFLTFFIGLFSNIPFREKNKCSKISTILFFVFLLLFIISLGIYGNVSPQYTERQYKEFYKSEVTLYNSVITYSYQNIHQGREYDKININNDNVKILKNEEFNNTISKSYKKMEKSLFNILFFTFELVEDNEYDIEYTVFLKVGE